MHSLIVGTTESGKSTLAKLLCSELAKKKQKCAVLTPTQESGWPDGVFKTTQGSVFLEHVKAEKELFCFVDESGDAIGKYDQEMNWLATGSRHLGHSVFFCLQATQQISTSIRSCCRKAYIFATSEGVIKLLAEDMNQPELKKLGVDIPRFHFLAVTRFGEKIKMGRLDNGGKSLYIGEIGELLSTQGDVNHDGQKTCDDLPDSDSGDLPDSGDADGV